MSGWERSALEVQAALALGGAHGLSLVYELWRATAKAGTSKHDSLRSFVRQNLALYAIASIVIALLLLGAPGAAWVGLTFSVVFILASILYYNPKIMLERQPGIVDWFEDLTYTGLLFISAALLLYEVLGRSLEAQ